MSEHMPSIGETIALTCIMRHTRIADMLPVYVELNKARDCGTEVGRLSAYMTTLRRRRWLESVQSKGIREKDYALTRGGERALRRALKYYMQVMDAATMALAVEGA